MRGGCWDAGQAVEEIALLLVEWRAGRLGTEEALERVEEALLRNNFGELMESEEQEDGKGVQPTLWESVQEEA